MPVLDAMMTTTMMVMAGQVGGDMDLSIEAVVGPMLVD